jgi:HSP20 family protein
MALVRWEPAREIGSLQSEMNRLFNTLYNSPTTARNAGGPRRFVPSMDLVETDTHYVLKADLPGLSEEDVAIEVADNVLTVTGERKSEVEEKKDGYRRVERSFGSFRRSLRIPEGVDTDAITARFDKGVLEVSVPKPEQRKPHRVAIETGDAAPALEGTETA